jgi:integration host factor subunit beta
MTKSELIERIVTHQGLLSSRMWSWLSRPCLSKCPNVWPRGSYRDPWFGSFSLHYRAPRVGRNPKTGQSVSLDGKFVPHFKPGKIA